MQPTQIAKLQGRTELQEEGNFSLLIKLLTPKIQGPMWSLNLGEIPFSLTQLVRIRKALSGPAYTITYLFMEQPPQTYPAQTHSSAVGRDAQVEAEKESGNPWGDIFCALVRANWRKHTRFCSRTTYCKTESSRESATCGAAP